MCKCCSVRCCSVRCCSVKCCSVKCCSVLSPHQIKTNACVYMLQCGAAVWSVAVWSAAVCFTPSDKTPLLVCKCCSVQCCSVTCCSVRCCSVLQGGQTVGRLGHLGSSTVHWPPVVEYMCTQYNDTFLQTCYSVHCTTSLLHSFHTNAYIFWHQIPGLSRTLMTFQCKI